MRGVTLYAALVCICGAAVAVPADPSPFSYPSAPVAPVPAPPVGAPVVLTADTLYVVSSKVDASVRAYPAGLVSVTKESGPLKIRAKFSDGSGKVESRTFPGPFVFIIEPVATGRTELVLTPFGLKSDADIEVKALDVKSGAAPQPPPKPDPVDPVDPTKYDKVFVVVVEDANVARTVEVAQMLNDPFWATLKPKHDFRHYLSTSKTAIDNNYIKALEQGGAGYPGVLILNPVDGAVIKSFRAKTIKEVQDAVMGVAK